jgi:pimeloyl-ACP methyl ester carboxylesterase
VDRSELHTDELGGWVRGDGRRVLLLHGGPGMAYTYLDTLADEIGEGYRVAAFQQRGLEPSSVQGPFDVATAVADVAAVLDALGWDRAWIVGHSWGGHLALHMLVSCPERIAGAIIVDPLGAHVEVMEEFGERLEAPLTDEERARFQEVEAREEAGTSTAEESMEALRIVWPSYYADPPTAPPMPDIELVVPAFVATMASVNAHAEAETLVRGLTGVPAEIPVLFVHGGASPMPVRASVDTAKLIPHAEVEVIEGAGHFIWHERPDEMRAVVRAFVARSSS